MIGPLGRDYIMDANEHFLFSGENLALNFILPLFIECGYQFERNFIQNILNNEKIMAKLHPAEIEYRNDPKFLDRYTWANSADPDQTAPR